MNHHHHHTIQSLVLPNLEVPATDDMSVRLQGLAWARMDTRCIEFGAGGSLSTDTFYNGLTVATWKRCCGLSELQLSLHGSGEFVLRLGLHRSGQITLWLDEQAVSLGEGRPAQVPVRAWAEHPAGMLFWTLRALRPGRLDGAAYVTPDAPSQHVRLGIVITHFNRQKQVLPGIARIRDALLQRPDLAPHLTLTVVDNSRNLGLESSADVRVIPSRNLGGTGGFVRGLLALIDSGDHTHALFMDDDASCETEAIARSVALLRHSRDPALAIGGALLREAAPWHLLEKGARFDGQVRPISPGLDMRRVDDLLLAEQTAVRPDYGAWWFFAFPLAEIKALPFPFFVRGDDIQFGLRNRFQITTLNGVACLGEDFSVKHSPMTAYLDARYHLVLALLDGRKVASRIGWVASRLFVKQLSAYHYSSARAVTLAVRHVLLGPDFFRRNLDLQTVRAEIGAWQPDEKMQPLDRAALGDVRPARNSRESALRRLGRLLTLQGFLLPDALLKNRTTVQDKAFHGRAAAVFRYRRVLYEHRPSGTGYVAAYDRPRFFAELKAFVPLCWRLLRRLKSLQGAYAQGAEAFGSVDFWREVHGQPAPVGAGMPPANVDAGAAASAPASPSKSRDPATVDT